MIAGPGSGKTEVLVLLCLKLVCVDRVPPASIIVTTFTERAANNIHDRIALYKEHLATADPGLRAVDLASVRIGTLHGLCNDIMQEYRHADYQNVRLLDEMGQKIRMYAAGYTFFISLFLWFVIMCVRDYLTSEQIILVGLFGMAVIFFVLWWYLSRKGIRT